MAIHAGARMVNVDELRALVLRLHSSHWRETGLERSQSLELLEPLLLRPKSLPRMAVLCLATLGRPIRDSDLEAQLGLPQVNDSDRDEHSSWGWPLTDAQRLEPYVLARGAQGWWNWKMTDA